ncbi:hypothetical protein ACHAQJ_010644, partial [Trichoderma viride]
EFDSYPADNNILDNTEVIYHEMPGWKKPTTNARTYDDLPKEGPGLCRGLAAYDIVGSLVDLEAFDIIDTFVGLGNFIDLKTFVG